MYSIPSILIIVMVTIMTILIWFGSVKKKPVLNLWAMYIAGIVMALCIVDFLVYGPGWSGITFFIVLANFGLLYWTRRLEDKTEILKRETRAIYIEQQLNRIVKENEDARAEEDALGSAVESRDEDSPR